MVVSLLPGGDEEVDTEHDEITGGAEAKELARKAAEEGADDLEEEDGVDGGPYEPIGEPNHLDHSFYIRSFKVY